VLRCRSAPVLQCHLKYGRNTAEPPLRPGIIIPQTPFPIPPHTTLTLYEKALTERPWHKVREGVEVKLLAQDNEVYGCVKAGTGSLRSGLCGGGR
jgi:hypothetical protein